MVTLFCAYVGTAFVFGGLALALAVALGSGKPGPTIFLSLVAGSYGLGVTALLLGRLVGSFLRDLPADLDLDEFFEPDTAPSTARRVRGNIEVDDEVDIDGLFAGADDEEGAFHVDKPQPRSTASTAANVPPVHIPAPSDGSVTAMLRNCERTAQTQPQRALDELEEWATHKSPHALVTSRLAVLQRRLDRPEALQTAKAAIAQARAASSVGALNEVYGEFKSQRDQLGLTVDDWLRMAAALTALGNPSRAVELYGMVLEQKPDAMPAWKGLIQIADDYLKLDDGAERALVVYDLLDRRAPDHPFGDFVDRGRGTAQRRLQKTR